MKRTACKVGYIFSGISYGLFALGFLLIVLATLSESEGLACGGLIEFLIAWIALFAGGGSLLASRNDLDDLHKKKVTIGASLILGFNHSRF